MNRRKKPLYIGLIVIFLSWAGNIAVFAGSQLKEPIMMKHYYEIPLDEGSLLQFHYLANRDGKMDIQWASVPGTDIMFFPSDHDGQIFNHHELKTLSASLNEHHINELKKHGGRITQISASLANGENKLLEIGEVTAYQRVAPHMTMLGTGSSNDERGYYLFQADSDLEITQMEIPFYEKLKSALFFGLNVNQEQLQRYADRVEPSEFPIGKDMTADIFPFSLKEGQLFSVNYHYTYKKDDPNQDAFFQINAKLHGKDVNGGRFTEDLTIFHQPYLDNQAIRKLVREAKK